MIGIDISEPMSSLDTPLPPIPPDQQFDSTQASIISNDSGFGASEEAGVHSMAYDYVTNHWPRSHRSGTLSVLTTHRPTSKSDSGRFTRRGILLHPVSSSDSGTFSGTSVHELANILIIHIYILLFLGDESG